MVRRLALAGTLCVGLLLPAAAPAQEQPTRAVWVTRYDYRTEADVRAIAKACAGLGANRVLFQVRGNASVFYPSGVEPWSHRLGGKDPGFDPLGVLLAEAKQRGLAVEAWINVLPLWKGTEPPKDPRHPYRMHPEWVVVGDDGKPQELNRHYVCANPARDDVREHLKALVGELARRYPGLDAVHMDYVRYVLDLETKRDFSHDAVSLERFGKDPQEEPAAWRAFKAAQVTGVVRALREALREVRPSCRLTAAVFPTRESRAKVGQDVESWVREGLVDALYPMTYADEADEFARRIRESLPLGSPEGAERPVPVFPGIAVHRHTDPAMTLDQLRVAGEAGATGVALFCYASFFASADQRELVTRDEGLRARRGAALQRTWGK